MQAKRRYAGLSVAERRAARRARLVETGLELFGTRGYAATTIEALCAVAGVTARHFYEEFPSREALLCEVYDRIARETMGHIDGALAAAADTGDARVRAGWSAYFSHVLSDPRRARIMVMEVAGVSRALEVHRRAVMSSFISQMVASLRRLEAAGLAPAIDVRLLGSALVGASAELTVAWVLCEPVDRPTVEELVALMTSIWNRTLRLDRRDERCEGNSSGTGYEPGVDSD